MVLPTRWTIVGGFVLLGMLEGSAQAAREAVSSEITYSTYVGGESGDAANDLAVADDGSVYVVGDTGSVSFPAGVTTYDLTPSMSSLDAFIAKIDPESGAIQFVTLFGGSSRDVGYSIDVSSGFPVVVGDTESFDFPVEDGFDDINGDGSCEGRDSDCAVDGFIAIFEPDGSAITFSSYLGGRGLDRATGVMTKDTTAWVTGFTESGDFPRKRATQSRRGNSDFFLMRIHMKSGAILSSTYAGGRDDEQWPVIEPLSPGAVVVGDSSSRGFPGRDGRFASRQGKESDGVVVRFGGKGGIKRASFIGGSAGESVRAVGVTVDGDVGVVGLTNSGDLPVKKAIQTEYGGDADAFLAVFDSSLQKLKKATYLGGSGIDIGWTVDHQAGVGWAVGGVTYSDDFPIKENFQEKPFTGCPELESSNCADAFVSIVGPRNLVFSSYLGGSDYDVANGVKWLPDGELALTGFTVSPDFPTMGAAQPMLLGTQDGFLTTLGT